MKRIHRFWSSRLMAGGILLVGLLFAGPTACDDPEESSDEPPSAESSPPEKSDKNQKADDESASETPPIPGGAEARTFEFKYETTIQPGEAAGPVDIFLPIATDTSNQEILDRTIDSSVEGKIRKESTYGNTFWHATLDELPSEPMTITMTYEVRREVFQRSDLEKESGAEFAEDERKEHELFLKANERVPTSGELIEEVAGDIGFDDYDSPAAEARAIYDYVVDTMEYKKVGEGWGNGDTYWACTEKFGNCTDFHALFTSLARYREIPARFEIGFPIPTDRTSGKIGGYHCWLDFYLPGVGWTPIDASEANKNPEYKELYFGTHPADRVQFTVGRDLELGEGHDTEPLNYFIYPMVEVGDERYEGIETEFSYTEKNT